MIQIGIQHKKSVATIKVILTCIRVLFFSRPFLDVETIVFAVAFLKKEWIYIIKLIPYQLRFWPEIGT